MVLLPDVLAGRVSLADIARAGVYLDMKADIDEYIADEAKKESEKHGKRSRP